MAGSNLSDVYNRSKAEWRWLALPVTNARGVTAPTDVTSNLLVVSNVDKSVFVRSLMLLIYFTA